MENGNRKVVPFPNMRGAFDTLASKALRGGGGSGDSGGMPPEIETRIAVLEQIAKDSREGLTSLRSDVGKVRDNQERDFRILFGAIIATALGLAGLMAKGFHWL
ncbi:MAG: hypothetical protein JNN22_14095 [Rhodospirillales bacterium]|nr:hypothetical protein [Rhodospirillales bacterium]